MQKAFALAAGFCGDAADFLIADEVDGSCSTGVAMHHSAVVMNC
ncbi:hypothetical protein [Leisingera sp. M658]|nr:hypothetical protein [Leisingera sp. M658]